MSHLLPLTTQAWQFREVAPRSTWRPARVPGCVHTDLLHHGLIPNPFHGTEELRVQWIEERDWEYAVTFDVSAALLAEEHVDLVADGLDTLATVTLNGQTIARTENMFLGHRWNVRALLRPTKNQLVVRFDSARLFIEANRQEHVAPKEFNDPVGGCTRLRKMQCQFGWDWGPRLVTAGIWRDLRLEGWSTARLESVQVRQDHSRPGRVLLGLTAEVSGRSRGLHVHATLSLDGQPVAEGTGVAPVLEVRDPELWWPAGHGRQPLYDLHVALRTTDGRVVSTWQRRLGLRTIQLDRHPDAWGESFQFVVNGRPLFAKGANWIPADSFVAGLTRADYARDLEAAVDAHMNMVRVWGGGIYESEDFYDLCDELGLLVWQDFMFACTLYPGDKAFLQSVEAEARHQVRRLRHRACLALWCGNNEIAQLNSEALKTPAFRRGYDAIFHRLLPDAVKEVDGATDYWPTSEWRGRHGTQHADGEVSGDTHFWDVWHLRKPVSDYEKWHFRFCSEFGMQSYASPETLRAFCPPGDRNLFGRSSENHQKNAAGNMIILDYVGRRYGLPKSQEALIHLSQLNQAYCMQVAVEHYRRNMPRCMGALYWQLNDCWPVASWSSIEHSGRWKALHFVARRFFAPALVSARVLGTETQGIGNYRRSDVHQVELHTVYDAPEPARGTLRWNLFHRDGRRLRSGRKTVALRYGESTLQLLLDFTAEIERHTTDHLYVRYALDVNGACVSQDTAFFAPPRFFAWPEGETDVTVTMRSSHEAIVRVKSQSFQHRFFLNVRGVGHQPSDNYFDLYPGEAVEVHVELDQPLTKAEFTRRLEHHSLAELLANDREE